MNQRKTLIELDQRLTDVKTRLNRITAGAGKEMHEPDNIGITATVTGEVLDNAMGQEPGYGELVVTIARYHNDLPTEVEHFNLAHLIALARLARF